MNSFKRFSEEKLPRKKCFYSHITDKEYLKCNKIWNEFNMKNLVSYQGHYLNKMFCY